MRCSCPNCDLYMVQVERGIKSGCKCPACAYICRACMGGGVPPLERDEIIAGYTDRGNPVRMGSDESIKRTPFIENR